MCQTWFGGGHVEDSMGIYYNNFKAKVSGGKCYLIGIMPKVMFLDVIS